MKLSQQSTTKVLNPVRAIQFIDEVYHVDEKGKRQGKCEKHDWFEVENETEGSKIGKQNPNVWSIGDPNRGRPAFAYVSERGTYKDDEKDGLWIQLGRDGSIIGITSYQSGERRGICMEHRYGEDHFYRIDEHGDECSVTQKEIEAVKKQAQEMIQDTSYHSTWVSKVDTKTSLLGRSRNILEH